MADCLLCKIVKGSEPSNKVLETDGFLVIENKFPTAPVHVLVLDKQLREKKDTMSGQHPGFWDEMMSTIWQAIKHLGLDKTGYKLINNGAGYNHFEHEHMHILGGAKGEPGGKT